MSYKKIRTILFLYIAVMAIALCVSFWYSVSEAATTRDVVFSWIPNSEPFLSGYEVYCDNKSQKNNPHKHSMWRSAPKGNINNGRVLYKWKNFPTGTDKYCVAVAVAKYADGKKLTSGFSTEVKVPKLKSLSPPEGIKATTVNININVTVTP